MSEASAKPYLVRAFCEWCADKNLTPYLVVKVNNDTRVPIAYVNNGEIVFNLSARTTHQLMIDNEWILFSARFDGVPQDVAIPFSAVAAIFAKETGYGLFFNAPPVSGETTGDDGTSPASPEKKKDSALPTRSSHLKLVK
ncbi:MAG: ClpXP protease specificity-enhancing factor [Burkholderiales bacterium]|jgi:stringent starvation protein B|nr:ClpXP protease specificity-enhancing factor [Burkholderiales bacterium]